MTKQLHLQGFSEETRQIKDQYRRYTGVLSRSNCFVVARSPGNRTEQKHNAPWCSGGDTFPFIDHYFYFLSCMYYEDKVRSPIRDKKFNYKLHPNKFDCCCVAAAEELQQRKLMKEFEESPTTTWLKQTFIRRCRPRPPILRFLDSNAKETRGQC